MPIAIELTRNKTRVWATIGIRLAHLNASYARPPCVRPKGSKEDWQDVKPHQIGSSGYVIPVAEFIEFELPGSNAMPREEFRALCDRYLTKDDILRALKQ